MSLIVQMFRQASRKVLCLFVWKIHKIADADSACRQKPKRENVKSNHRFTWDIYFIIVITFDYTFVWTVHTAIVAGGRLKEAPSPGYKISAAYLTDVNLTSCCRISQNSERDREEDEFGV